MFPFVYSGKAPCPVYADFRGIGQGKLSTKWQRKVGSSNSSPALGVVPRGSSPTREKLLQISPIMKWYPVTGYRGAQEHPPESRVEVPCHSREPAVSDINACSFPAPQRFTPAVLRVKTHQECSYSRSFRTRTALKTALFSLFPSPLQASMGKYFPPSALRDWVSAATERRQVEPIAVPKSLHPRTSHRPPDRESPDPSQTENPQNNFDPVCRLIKGIGAQSLHRCLDPNRASSPQKPQIYTPLPPFSYSD